MEYFLAFDQGGSKTEALLFNNRGEILGFADDRDIRKPDENYGKSQGKWIHATAQKALSKASLTLGDISGVCCALNGADWDTDYDRLRTLVSNELSIEEKKVRIVNDCIGAMRGGTDSPNRAVLCLGTGMNCAVRAENGNEHIFGYFVPAIDQGGSALGTSAWISIIEYCSGLGEETMITELILKKYGENSFFELFPKITSGQVPFKWYDMCPLLMTAAKAGDTIAVKIVKASAQRMVRYIEEGTKKLGITDVTVKLVLTGGVFKGDGYILFDTIKRIINEKNLNVECVKPSFEPVAGAALLILDELDKTLRTQALKRFEADTASFNVRLSGG